MRVLLSYVPMNLGEMLKELPLVDHVTLPNSLPAISGPSYTA